MIIKVIGTQCGSFWSDIKKKNFQDMLLTEKIRCRMAYLWHATITTIYLDVYKTHIKYLWKDFKVESGIECWGGRETLYSASSVFYPFVYDLKKNVKDKNVVVNFDLYMIFSALLFYNSKHFYLYDFLLKFSFSLFCCLFLDFWVVYLIHFFLSFNHLLIPGI